jgi:intracellular sulfur oxidation DsrE/DsrF family protein
MHPRAIFHIDEMQKWRLLLHNVRNLLSSYDDTDLRVTIEVLANSEAVRGYVLDGEAGLQERMEALHEKNVIFTACNNALQGQNIQREQLFAFVNVVSAGVRELTDRQMEGYAYIKP